MSPLRHRRNGTVCPFAMTVYLAPFGCAWRTSSCFKARNKRSSGTIFSMLNAKQIGFSAHH
jgi:hypothetical protein